MVILGLLLLVASALLTAGMVVHHTQTASVSMLGHTVTGSVGTMFVAGMMTGIVAVLGVMLLVRGLARRRARRLALKRQVQEARGEQQNLAEENARLQRELAGSRADVYPTGESGSRAVPGRAGRHRMFTR